MGGRNGTDDTEMDACVKGDGTLMESCVCVCSVKITDGKAMEISNDEGFANDYLKYGTPRPHCRDDQGLIGRLVHDLYDHIRRRQSDQIVFEISGSFIEIYLEQINDLLQPANKNLRVRENTDKGVYVDDLLSVRTPTEDSSRSHTVLVVNMVQRDVAAATEKRATMYVVDLAGSEMVMKTLASGKTLNEAKAINKSLSALSNVIKALGDGHKHIPFRDSKLTRILQDSLGGHAKTCLIVTVSSSSYNVAETISTVRFGTRAKEIKNDPTLHEVQCHISATSSHVGHNIVQVQDASMCDYQQQQLQELIQATANSSTRPPGPIMTHLLSPALTSLLFADQTATQTDLAPPLGHADLVAQLSQLQEDACNTRTAELESALDALKEINRTISAQNTVLSDRNLELEALDTARANLAPTDVVTVGRLPEAPNMAALSNDYVPSSALVDTLTRKLVEMKMHVHFMTEYTKSILDHEPYEIVHQLTQLKLDNERLRELQAKCQERQQNLLKEVEYYKMIWQRSAPTTKRDNNQQPLFTTTTSFTPSHITLPADGGTTQHSLFKAASFSGVVPVEPLSLMSLKRSSNRKIVKPQSPKPGGCMHLPHTNSPIIHANQVRKTNTTPFAP
ncbi:hypothetical protein DYB31_000989 [Aphanomyces astaci]|uniref:Kinesin-like protein n=2 Tax=Aphanomyces astaci TaxID=112090 RepID=A0A397F7V7_APHAT|nr:hypothetical protein DYB31_000989 [Aphanomyces astaci]